MREIKDEVQPLPLVAVINNTSCSFGCSHLPVVHFSAPLCVCYLQLIIKKFLLLKSPRKEISKKAKYQPCYQSQVQEEATQNPSSPSYECRVKHKVFLQDLESRQVIDTLQ